MTDEGDQAIIQMAEDIQRRRAKQKEEDFEYERDNWFRSKLGKYYQEVFTGAHDEAFKVFYIRDIDWCHYLKTDYIMFAHIGHFGIGVGSISYTEHEIWRFRDKYYKEITEVDYLGYLNKFLELTGWKQKLEKESDH